MKQIVYDAVKYYKYMCKAHCLLGFVYLKVEQVNVNYTHYRLERD
jgi:hypothetical protein